MLALRPESNSGANATDGATALRGGTSDWSWPRGW